MVGRMIVRFLVALAIAVAAGLTPAHAQTQGRRAQMVVELYTSQGCTQCPRANRLLGIWWAGKLLYPREFADVDLRAKVVEFHRRFYHREPSASQLDALLNEPGVLPR